MSKKWLPPGVCEISRKTGISPAHVSKIFNGRRMPSLANAALIASALKISLDELYMRLVHIQERVLEADAAENRIAEALEKDRLRAEAAAASTVNEARNGQEASAST